MERKETTLENRGKMIRVEERTGEEREGWNWQAEKGRRERVIAMAYVYGFYATFL